MELRRCAVLGIGLMLLLGTAGLLRADDSSSFLEVAPLDPGGLGAEPRTVQMVLFRVANHSGKPISLQPDPILPAGWRSMAPPFPLTLEPGASDLVYLSFLVPQEALAGTYPVGIAVRPADPAAGEPVRAEASIPVFIAPRFSLALQLLSAPGTAIAGTSYQADFRVQNGGNAFVDIILRISESHDLPRFLEADRLSLAPGEARTVTVLVMPPDTLREAVSHRLTLTAVMVGRGVQAQAQSTVQIIPVTPSGDPWHRYPLTIGAGAGYSASREEPWTASIGLSGSGTLDSAGHHRLSFSIKPYLLSDGAESWGGGTFTYSFTRDGFSFTAGTPRVWALAPLVTGAAGAGFETGWLAEDERFRVKAVYAFDNKPGSIPGQTLGVQVWAKYGDVNTIQADVRLAAVPDAAAAGSMIGLRGFNRPYDAASLSWDFAGGFDVPDSWALLLTAEAREKAYTYSFSLRSIGAGFPSETPDQLTFGGSGTLNAFPGLSLSGGWTETRNNRSLDPALSSGLQSSSARFGAEWGREGLTISLGRTLYQQNDLLSPGMFDYRKESTALQLRMPLDRINLGGSYVQNQTWGEDGTGQAGYIYGVTANWSSGSAVNLSGSLTLDSGQRTTGLSDSLLTGRFNVSWRISREREFKAACQVSFQPLQDTGSGTISLNWRHISQQWGSYAVTASWTGDWGAVISDSLAFSVSGSLPIRIPVSLKPDIGALEGVVRSFATGEGVGGVIVTVGRQTTITGSEGKFRFPALDVGMVELTLNTALLPAVLIPVETPPLTVEVVSRETVAVDITLAAPARLEGKVQRLERDPRSGLFLIDPPLVEAGGFGTVLIELSRGPEVRRTLTASDGTFSFSGLVPGTWVVRIVGEGIPDTHAVERDSWEISLDPGGTGQIVIEARPVRREIRFLQMEVIPVD